MRLDFVEHSTDFWPEQLSRLAELHDWLIDDCGLPSCDIVRAIANHKPRGFLQKSNEVLLITGSCFAFTTPKLKRVLPLSEIDITSPRVSFKEYFLRHPPYTWPRFTADLELMTKKGERLSFFGGYQQRILEVENEFRYDEYLRRTKG